MIVTMIAQEEESQAVYRSPLEFVKAVQGRHHEQIRERNRQKCSIRVLVEKEDVVKRRMEFQFNSAKINVPYTLSMKGSSDLRSIEYRQVFEIKQIGLVQLGGFWQKPRQKLVETVRVLNHFLEKKKSQLKAVLTGSDYIQLFTHSIFIIDAVGKSAILQVTREINALVYEFVSHFRHLNQVDFLKQSPRIELFPDQETRRRQFVGQCLKVYLQNRNHTKEEKQWLSAKIKANIGMFQEEQTSKQPICEGIQYVSQTKAATKYMEKLQSDLKLIKYQRDNYGRKENKGNSISIIELHFYVLTTMAAAREGFRCEDFRQQLNEVGDIKKQTVIRKRFCLEDSTEDEQQSYLNELEFLRKHGALRCRFVKKYYLPKSENSIYDIYSPYEGGDLWAEVASSYGRNFNDYLLIFQQMAQVVQFLVKNDILHRDIKPTNVILTTRDGRLAIKLIDFGSWCSIPPNIKQKKLSTTKGYSLSFGQALEKDETLYQKQLNSEKYHSHKAFDIYSIGATMNVLLKLSGHKSLALDKIIEYCMRINPNQRPEPKTLINWIIKLRLENHLDTLLQQQKLKIGQ